MGRGKGRGIKEHKEGADGKGRGIKGHMKGHRKGHKEWA